MQKLLKNPNWRETDQLAIYIACEQAPGWVLGRASRVWSRASVVSRERSGEEREAREPVDILLMPPFHDTRIWYHDLIG